MWWGGEGEKMDGTHAQGNDPVKVFNIKGVLTYEAEVHANAFCGDFGRLADPLVLSFAWTGE